MAEGYSKWKNPFEGHDANSALDAQQQAAFLATSSQPSIGFANPTLMTRWDQPFKEAPKQPSRQGRLPQQGARVAAVPPSVVTRNVPASSSSATPSGTDGAGWNPFADPPPAVDAGQSKPATQATVRHASTSSLDAWATAKSGAALPNPSRQSSNPPSTGRAPSPQSPSTRTFKSICGTWSSDAWQGGGGGKRSHSAFQFGIRQIQTLTPPTEPGYGFSCCAFCVCSPLPVERRR